MTKELEKKFQKKYPLYSQEGLGEEAEVVVKYFNPTGRGTWLITEGEKQEDGDWLLFGFCHLYEWEWGYITLSELENVKNIFGIGIEREMYVTGGKVGDYLD
jgi:hypothetical protein